MSAQSVNVSESSGVNHPSSGATCSVLTVKELRWLLSLVGVLPLEDTDEPCPVGCSGILEPGGLTGKAEVGVCGTGFCWSLWARTLLSSGLFRPRAHPISFLVPNTFLPSPTSPAMTLHTVPASLYSHYQDRPDPSLAQDPSLDPHAELPNRVQ